MLAGLLQTTIVPPQRVQNAAAHLIFELGTREPSSVALVAGGGPLTGQVKAVLSHALNLLREGQEVSDQHRKSCRLWSSSLRSKDFSLPRLHKCGEHAFAYAGVEHSTMDLRAVTDPGLFRRQLKINFSVCRLMSVDDVNKYVMHSNKRMVVVVVMMMMMIKSASSTKCIYTTNNGGIKVKCKETHFYHCQFTRRIASTAMLESRDVLQRK